MPVPVLLVAGFLGAGKTTFINHALKHAGGRRIAAVVNDFGAINIDEALIDGAEGGVVGLKNGCICCSLEGDLLRTLASLLRRDPRPETIVIETSGVAEPADIVRNLMDPVIAREALLETVLCIADAAAPAGAFDDALLRGQIKAADIVALSKTDIAGAEAIARNRAAIAAINPRAVVVEAPFGAVPLELVFPADPGRVPPRRDPERQRPRAERFESLSWTSPLPLSLPRLQRAIGRLSPRLARAKGLFETVEPPGRRYLLQLAGGRAVLAPAEKASADGHGARFVFIAEIGRLSPAEIEAAMAICIADGPARQM